MNIKTLTSTIYKEYVKNGYEEMWSNTENFQKKNDIAELGLIVAEISESMEEIRKKHTNNKHLAIECTDIIIRTLNFMNRKHLNIEQALQQAINKNNKRPKLHGKQV